MWFGLLGSGARPWPAPGDGSNLKLRRGRRPCAPPTRRPTTPPREATLETDPPCDAVPGDPRRVPARARACDRPVGGGPHTHSVGGVGGSARDRALQRPPPLREPRPAGPEG